MFPSCLPQLIRPGPASGARAFLESPPAAVVLCANRLGSRREVEEAVVHELIHAYDYLVAGIDLLDCRSLAYRFVFCSGFRSVIHLVGFCFFTLFLDTFTFEKSTCT